MHSFYVHATTFCNMSCAHCCMNYGNGKAGRHMSVDQIRRIIVMASDMSAFLTLGGGEITLHPQFEEILSMCTTLYKPTEKSFWGDKMKIAMITNGSMKDRALMLNKLAVNGEIRALLSWDQFHDPVDEEVVKAYVQREDHDGSGLNGHKYTKFIRRLMNHGRAKKLKNKLTPTGDKYDLYNGCMCESTTFYPTGTVRVCGCPESTILTRNFMKDFTVPEYFKDNRACYKTYAQYLKELEAKMLRESDLDTYYLGKEKQVLEKDMTHA